METASQAVNLHEQIQGVEGPPSLTIIAFTIVFLVLAAHCHHLRHQIHGGGP